MKINATDFASKLESSSKSECVTIPWEGDEVEIWVKKASYAEILSLYDLFSEMSREQQMAAIVSRYILKEDGTPILSEQQAIDLLPFEAGQSMVNRFNEINGLGKSQDQEILD
jgi:hypothetical protein